MTSRFRSGVDAVGSEDENVEKEMMASSESNFLPHFLSFLFFIFPPLPQGNHHLMIWERSSLASLFFFIFFSIILSTSLAFGPYMLLDNTDEDWVIGYSTGKEDAVQRRSRLRPRRSKKADLQPTLVCA